MKVVFLHTDFRIYWPARLEALIEYFKTLAEEMSITDLLQEVIEKTGYIESLENEEKKRRKQEKRI